MTCPYCDNPKAGTTERGLGIHMKRCTKNPANVPAPESVTDRLQRRANEWLAEAERIVRELHAELNYGDHFFEKAQRAVDAFDAYRDLGAILQTGAT